MHFNKSRTMVQKSNPEEKKRQKKTAINTSYVDDAYVQHIHIAFNNTTHYKTS